MKIEALRKSHKKSIVIGISIFIVLAIVLIARFTFAKYELVKSIKIAEGTINYKVPDFKMMAMYKNDGNGDTEIETMPESGYTINESKSYCTLDNINKDTKVKLFTNEEGKHVISGLSKSSKCYLYFDKKLSAGETILANVTVNEGAPNFSKTAQITCSNTNCETTNGVYKSKDDDGDTYYFRGSVDNNYIKFANKWWRIIRINGDGTIRLIYDGTSAHANGTSTSDSIAVAEVKWAHKDAYWNSSIDNAYTNNNAYVGFMYTLNEVHGLGTKSNALQELEIWYTNNLSNYAAKLDANAGFCGDRTPSTSDTTSNGLGGTGTTVTYYGGYIRLLNGGSSTNSSPVLTCDNTSDLYTVSSSNKGNKSLTYPIGLISADEVSMAGGLTSAKNQNYYLYNGQDYWTLSPRVFMRTSAYVSCVDSGGGNNSNHMHAILGLRPVINLKADIKLTGKGTTSDPYVVS